MVFQSLPASRSAHVGVGTGSDVGVGAGVGVGGVGGATSRSVAMVTYRRYPVAPVPELSRWPSGPVARTVDPAARLRPPSASGVTTIRTGPVPSSTETAVPSASASVPPTTSPSTEMRRPSTASVAAPVPISSAPAWPTGSSAARSASASRRVRWSYRLASVPVIRTRVAGATGWSATASR